MPTKYLRRAAMLKSRLEGTRTQLLKLPDAELLSLARNMSEKNAFDQRVRDTVKSILSRGEHMTPNQAHALAGFVAYVQRKEEEQIR